MPRMWMVPTHGLCQKHLVAEHHECHVFFGKLRLQQTLTGYIKNNLFQVTALWDRHEHLAEELGRRGLTHLTPLPDEWAVLETAEYLPHEQYYHVIDKLAAWEELVRRCDDCAKRLGVPEWLK